MTIKSILILAVISTAYSFGAATQWYVDKNAPGPTHDGTSWNNAWLDVTSISGVAAGDTIQISGGASGGSVSYSLGSQWLPTGGSAGNPITYHIGQDSSHNGIAIFSGPGSGTFVGGNRSNIIISGDAGDGAMHFRLASWSAPCNADNDINVRFSYVDCGAMSGGFHASSCLGVEIDHCLYRKWNGSDDYAIIIGGGASSYDANKIHHNTIYLPRNSAGLGDDGVQDGGDGLSLYNNIFIGYLTNYSGGQHQDGFQPLGGNHYKVYNNYFRDIANYPIFFDAYFGDFSACRVFNNVLVITDSALQASDPPQGIAIGPDGGSFSQMGRWPSFTDIIVANNLVSDYGDHNAINFRNNPGQNSVFSQCALQNNAIVNSGGIGSETSITNNHNVTFTSGQAPSHFVAYSTLSTNSDYHIINSSESSLKDAGIDLSAYFTTDSEGNTRPQGSSWDIGPLEFLSGGGTTGGTGATYSVSLNGNVTINGGVITK